MKLQKPGRRKASLETILAVIWHQYKKICWWRTAILILTRNCKWYLRKSQLLSEFLKAWGKFSIMHSIIIQQTFLNMFWSRCPGNTQHTWFTWTPEPVPNEFVCSGTYGTGKKVGVGDYVIGMIVWYNIIFLISIENEMTYTSSKKKS